VSYYALSKGKKIALVLADGTSFCPDCADEKILDPRQVKNLSDKYTCAECGKRYWKGYLQHT
jgi:predicted RNA-binding Zn-ribbon protein involved in translation (DUF1610 family)